MTSDSNIIEPFFDHSYRSDNYFHRYFPYFHHWFPSHWTSWFNGHHEHLNENFNGDDFSGTISCIICIIIIILLCLSSFNLLR